MYVVPMHHTIAHCEGQRSAFRSQCSPSTTCVMGSNSGHKAWWQAPLPNELYHWPSFKKKKRLKRTIKKFLRNNYALVVHTFVHVSGYASTCLLPFCGARGDFTH